MNPVTPIRLAPPKGADHWRKRFDATALTLLPGSYERIREALNQTHSSADTVAQALAPDPAACLLFYLRANRLLAPTGNELKSLPHLVSLLGFTQVQKLLRALPVAEQPLPHYWSQLQQSLLRTRLLAALPLQMAGLHGESLYFACLFSGLPRWLAWHFASEEQAALEGLARNPRIGRPRARALVYGADLQPNLLVQGLPLPKTLLAAYAQPDSAFRRAARALLAASRGLPHEPLEHRPELLLWLVDRLCEAFCAAPTQPRCQRLARLLAQLLQTRADTVITLLHRSAAQLPVLHPVLQDEHPARRLLCQWPLHAGLPVYALPAPGTATDPTEPVITANDAPAGTGGNRLLDNRFRDATRVKATLEMLSRGHPDLNSLNNIFQCLLNGLDYGMGLTLGALLLPSPDQQRWSARFQFGPDDERLFGPLESTELTVRLAGKRGSVLINDDNRSAMAAQLPVQLAALTDRYQLLLVSLLYQQKPVALLLAAEPDLSPPRVQTVNRLAQAGQAAIQRLAGQIRRRAAAAD